MKKKILAFIFSMFTVCSFIGAGKIMAQTEESSTKQTNVVEMIDIYADEAYLPTESLYDNGTKILPSTYEVAFSKFYEYYNEHGEVPQVIKSNNPNYSIIFEMREFIYNTSVLTGIAESLYGFNSSAYNQGFIKFNTVGSTPLQTDYYYGYTFGIEFVSGYEVDTENIQFPEGFTLIADVNKMHNVNLENRVLYVGYQIAKAETAIITDLELEFNKDGLDNMNMVHGEYEAYNDNDLRFPNIGQIITSYNEFAISEQDKAINGILSSGRYDSMDDYWAEGDRAYQEMYGTNYPEELKYIAEGRWAYKYGDGISDIDLSFRYNNRFKLLAERYLDPYALVITFETKTGAKFDEYAIAESLAEANEGFLVDKGESDGKKLVIYYQLGKAKPREIDLEIQYNSDKEVEVEISAGFEVPKYYETDGNGKITSGVFVPTNQDYLNKGLYHSTYIFVLDTPNPTDEDFYNSMPFRVGEKVTATGYVFYYASFGCENGYILSDKIFANGTPAGYTVSIGKYDQYDSVDGQETLGVSIYKYLGKIEKTKEIITSVDVFVKEAFMEKYLQGINPNTSPLQTTNFDKYGSIGGNVYIKGENGALVLHTGSTFEPDVQYVASMIVITGTSFDGAPFENYVFADNISLPTGFTCKKYSLTPSMVEVFGEDATAIEVLYELPMLTDSREEITSVNISINEDFMKFYNQGILYTDIDAFDVPVNEQDKYYVLGYALYYEGEEGQLVYIDLEYAADFIFELDVQYHISIGLLTGTDKDGFNLGGYKFADNVTVPTGYTVGKVEDEDYFYEKFGPKATMIQLFYELPIIEEYAPSAEEITSVNIEVNQGFYQEYLQGIFSGEYPGCTVLDNNANYKFMINTLYYLDSNNKRVVVESLEEENGISKFEYGVQYVLGLVLITGADENGFNLSGYKFADNVTAPQGFTVEKFELKSEMLEYFGKKTTAIEVFYELPKLQMKEVTSINVKVNEDFMTSYLKGQFNDEIYSFFTVLDEKFTYAEFDWCMYFENENNELKYYDPFDTYTFENNVKYFVSIIYLNGTNAYNMGLGGYQFVDAENITVPQGFTVKNYALHPNNVLEFGENVRAVEVFYELPILDLKPFIEFTYDAELEPTIEELGFGNKVPVFVDYEIGKGFIYPTRNFETKLDGGVGIVVHKTKTPEDYYVGEMLIPNQRVNSTGHVFAVATFKPWNGFTFTEDMEIIGLPEDYEYELDINETNPQDSRIVIYKYLGQIKKFIEFAHDAEYEPTIEELALGNTVPQYVDYEIGKGFILPAANSESKAWGEIGIIVYQTKTIENYQLGEFLAPGKTSQYHGYVFAVGVFGPGYDFTFTEDMEIIGLPEDYEYKLEINETDNRESILLVYKYLGELRLPNLNDEEAEITLSNTLVYNGQDQTQQIVVKYDGVTLTSDDYEVAGNINKNAGSYKLTVTGKGEYAGTVEVDYVIAKAKVALPEETTSFIYDGTAKVSVTAHDLYTVTNGSATNAGNYEAVITLKDTTNYEWAESFSGKIAWTIAKATYDMSGIKFENVTVTYDGAEHKALIAGTLPEGVTVTYNNNVATNVGVYNAVAKFVGDVNYNTIPEMNATITIKTVSMSFDTDKDNEQAEDVIVSSPEGIDPNKELYVELIEMEESDKDFKEFLNRGQRVGIAYDVKLLKDGVSVQPDGTLKIKILIPEQLKNKDFGIMHVHNSNETSMLDYVIEGNYVVFETNKLSEFVFVYEMGSLLWIAIVLAVIALLEGAFLVFLINQKKKLKTKKLASVYPPFILGMFVPEWHITLIIIFAIIVAALAAIDVVYAISFFRIKFKATSKTEDDSMIVIENEEESFVPQVEENHQEVIQNSVMEVDEDDDEDVIQVWDEETHSFTIIRIIKSFTARLIQSKDEVKDYYDIIKNELLSYKKVKSRISFKHEAFKFGKENIARLRFRGKTLCLYLALNPADYENTKYKIEDMSSVANSSDVPTMYRINLPRRVEYAKELIYDLMKKLDAERINIDFVKHSNNYPYEDNEALLEKGLIKKSVKTVGEGTSTKTLINPVNIVKKVNVSEVNNLITDEQVIGLIKQSSRIADKTKKTIINIDTLSQYFNENETVTLEEIKKRIPNIEKKTTYYKVLANGTLDKPLIVDADDFSIEAEKMIIVTGGKVLVSKSK